MSNQRNLELGIKEFKLGNYRNALNILKPFAESGDPEAQCILGNIYQLGLGVTPDGAIAVRWYQFIVRWWTSHRI